VTCRLIHHINFNIMFNVNVIFISYLRLVIHLLRTGRHGKILIEQSRRDSEKFGNHCNIPLREKLLSGGGNIISLYIRV
jgi:hypothetical protein